MKTPLYSFLASSLAVLLLASPAHAATPPAVKPRDIVTRDNQSFHHATIIGRNNYEIMIASDEGTTYIQLDNLPADMQKELGYMGPGVQEKLDADKAAAAKAAADKMDQDKLAKVESSKHEIIPGTEKDPFPQLNPDYFPAELAGQLASYNTKAQISNMLAGGKKPPYTDATLKANADKLAALHTIYSSYKTFIENPPAGADAPAARKAVAASDYKPYPDMPEVVFETIRGTPDKVETSKSADNATEVKTYSYGDFKFLFQNGKFWQLKAPPK